MSDFNINICCCIILYNPNEDFVITSIDLLQTYFKSIIVIDNSKTKNFKIEKMYRLVKYIYNNGNIGIASAMNIACSEAINSGFDYILMLDQDSIFDEKNLVAYLKNISVYKKNDKIAVFSSNYLPCKENMKDHLEHKYIKIAITSGSVFDLRIFKKLHGFTDKLFIDIVDFDYCLKAINRGYTIISFPNIELNHNLGETKHLFHNFGHAEHIAVRLYYMTRNTLYTFSNYLFSNFFISTNLLLRLFRKFIVIIIFEKQKKEKLYYIYRGVKDFINNKYGELKE
jgi:rhamnosyltransferase